MRTLRQRVSALVYALLVVNAAAVHAQDAADVRVMTFNIRFGTAPDSANQWTLRRDFLFEVIRTSAPHVLGVQEALGFQLDEIRAALPQYAQAGVGRDDGRTGGEYSPILYDSTRLTLLANGTFWFSDTPETPGSTSWGNRITRICSWAVLHDRTTRRSFAVYNVHWDHESQPSRERSAALLLARIAARDNPELPVLVTGDFNAGETNAAFRKLVTDDDLKLRDTFRVTSPGADSIGTFHAFQGRREGEKIDAILASPEWQVKQARIVRSAQAGRYPSDHFPVSAVVRLGG
jgi:endonuclease/exonuclease/phosphatase family metal-dependent hydrolase